MAGKKSLERKMPKKASARKSPSQADKLVDLTPVLTDEMQAKLDAYEEVGKTQFTCSLCGKLIDTTKKQILAPYYKSQDPHNKIGFITVCRDCVNEIVYRIEYRSGKEIRHVPTVASIKEALQYLDKPWFSSIYEKCIRECQDEHSKVHRDDPWMAYIDRLKVPQMRGLRWRDGDGAKRNADEWQDLDGSSTIKDEEAKKVFELNKKKVLHDLGYNPFVTADPDMQPLMFNKLAGYLDESTSDDQLKLDACIGIVQATAQADSYDHMINYLQKTPTEMIRNLQTIKDLGAAKKDSYKVALDLAKDNGISAKFNNNNSKGGKTWSGQVKALREGQYRFGEVNNFDIGTADGMAQVAKMSAEAIVDQIRLDDSDYADMVAKQREVVTEAIEKEQAATEEARVLKRENKDLKDYMRKQGLLDEKDQIIG